MIFDDAAAKAIILETGLLERLNKRGLSEILTFAIEHENPTHWIFCAHTFGHPVASENGHMVIAWPKQHFAWESVKDSIIATLRGYGITQGLAIPYPAPQTRRDN